MVTRDELMAHVWEDSQAHSNVIDVYASRLRRKIDEGEEEPLLVTHHGVGYALEAGGDQDSRGSSPAGHGPPG